VLKTAKGLFLLWPRRFIVVESMGESEPTNLCPPPIIKGNHSNPHPANPPSKVVALSEMPPFVKLLFQKLSQQNTYGTYNFPAPKGIFGVGKLITLCWVDFEDMWRSDMLCETLMSLYQW
jgi:hypothetical protein